MSAPRLTAIVIVLSLALISCAATLPTPQSLYLDNKVDLKLECTAAYRSSVQLPFEKQDRILLSQANQTAALTYTDLIFNAMYSPGGYDVPYLKVWVTSANSKDELYASLFQFSPITPTVNQFVGIPAFTGLQYAYHPTTRAELQFWCGIQ